MNHLFDISYRFFQHFDYSGEDDPYVQDSAAVQEAIGQMYEQLKDLVEQKAAKGPWGPVKWIEVGVGDDDEEYFDSTQIEYFFIVQYAAAESEVKPDSERENCVCLTEETLKRLQSEWEKHLYYDYAPNLTVEVEPARKMRDDKEDDDPFEECENDPAYVVHSAEEFEQEKEAFREFLEAQNQVVAQEQAEKRTKK